MPQETTGNVFRHMPQETTGNVFRHMPQETTGNEDVWKNIDIDIALIFLNLRQ